MMNQFSKFAFISGGGLALLMVIGLIISRIFNLGPDEVRSLNVVEDWMFYRLLMYALIVIFWVPICRWLTFGVMKQTDLDLSDAELEQKRAKREEDVAFLKGYWWKIALMFAFFELVFIQQLGV